MTKFRSFNENLKRGLKKEGFFTKEGHLKGEAALIKVARQSLNALSAKEVESEAARLSLEPSLGSGKDGRVLKADRVLAIATAVSKAAIEELSAAMVGKNKEEKAMRIVNKRELELVSKRALRKKGGHILAISLTAKSATIESVLMPGSKLTDEVMEPSVAPVKMGGVSSKRVDRFSDKLLFIKFEGSGKNAGKTRASLAFEGVYVGGAGAETKAYFKLSASKFYDLESNKEVTLSKKEATSLKKYTPLGGTPSILRKENVAFGLASFDWETLTNKLSYGALEMFSGSKGNLAALNKMLSRMFQQWTPSQTIGQAQTFAIYNGKFGLTGEEDPADGLNFLSANFMAKGLSEALSSHDAVYEVDPRAVVGMGFQNRPDMNKSFGLAVSQETMGALVEAYGEVVRFEDFRSLSNDAIKEIATSSKYKGKTVVFGSGEPDYFVDRNSLKADFDFSKGGEMNILAFAKRSGASTSIQMLSKAIYALGDEVAPLIQNLFDEHAKKAIGGLANNEASMAPYAVAETGYLRGIIQDIAPEFAAKKDRSLFRTSVDNAAQTLLKAANRLKFEVDGASLSLMPDFGALFGVKLLKMGEAYSPYAARRQARSVKKMQDAGKICAEGVDATEGLVIKYPSVGMKEFYAPRLISLSQMVKRIKASRLSWEVKSVLIDMYKTLSNGILVMPTDEELKSILAGMDFDFDGATLILDPRLVKLFKKIQPTLVDIQAEGKEEAVDSSLPAYVQEAVQKLGKKEISLEMSNFKEALSVLINNDMPGVGEITVMIEAVTELLGESPARAAELLNKSLEKGKKEAIAKGRIEKDAIYAPLERGEKKAGTMAYGHVSITEACIEDYFNMLYSTGVNVENVKQVILDLSDMGRFWQEVTIDSTKTGEFIEVPLDLSFSTRSTVNFSYHIGDDFRVTLVEEEENEDRDYVRGPVYNIKKRLAKRAILMLDAIASANDPRFDDADMAKLIAKQHESANVSTIKSLSMIKFMLGDLTGSRIIELQQAEVEGRDTTEIKEIYASRVEGLANMIRVLTPHHSHVDRAMLVKIAAMASYNGELMPASTNTLPSIIAPEYIRFISKFFGGENAIAGEEVIGNAKDGDEVAFLNGRAAGVISLDKEITGTFTIKEVDGKLYATQPIEDVMTVPAVDDTRITFRLKNVTDAQEAVSTINSLSQIHLVANKDDGDKVTDLDGNVLAEIDLMSGDVVMSKLLNAGIGEVDSVYTAKSRRKGGIIDVVYVTLKNFDKSAEPVAVKDPSAAFEPSSVMDVLGDVIADSANLAKEIEFDESVAKQHEEAEFAPEKVETRESEDIGLEFIEFDEGDIYDVL